MKQKIKHISIYVAGWGFIILGILGLFLPVLQGILFLLVGLSILSTVSPWAERLLDRLKKRFPKASKHFEEAKEKTKAYFKKKADRAEDIEEKM